MTEASLMSLEGAHAGVQQSPRQVWINIFVLALLCLFCAPFFVNTLDPHPPGVNAGVASFANTDALTRPVSLAGEWRFRWETESRNPSPAQGEDRIQVPGTWSGQTSTFGKHYPPQGHARYRLTLTNLPRGDYRLYVPTIFAASRISVNGVEKSRRGEPGADASSTRYFWRASDVLFEATGKPVEIEIEESAFLHRDNGIEVAPILGRADAMQTMFAQRWMQELLFQAALMLLAIYCGVVFLFRREDRASLYLGVACVAFMPVTAMLGFDNILLVLFPGLSFSALLGLVYVATGVAMIFFLSYANALFPAESPRWAYRTLAAVVAVFFAAQAIALASSGTLLTSQINGYLWLLFLLYFPYIIFVLVRAVIRNRDGATPFLIGMTALAISITMMEIVAAGLAPASEVKGFNFITYGILILMFSHLIVLAERWALSIRASESMNEDLRQLLAVNSSITSEMELGALLGRIVEATTRILKAERSTLFLYDGATDELWSMIAQGVGSRELRFASSVGLAGETFQMGEATIETDVYNNPQFNRVFDSETGFKTHDVISMPITTREGRKLGVMQALNRADGLGFTQEDALRMQALAAQAAIALDNATLFSEVVASRNFNESILSSMSSGVVTIDRDDRITKVNQAARDILGAATTALEGMDARAILAETNPWMLREIDEVSESDRAKVLLDVDLATRYAGIKSVNLSLVPLINEGERAGVLTLLEDISEGKRLQGAMRRFMPQKIVDQVLGRDDDLLFGSACQASVVFADIRGFTSMTEQLSPRETVDLLNGVFTELFEAVAASDGILDKYIGDAIMAVYGVPLPGDRDADNAVCGAVEMISLIEMINAKRAVTGLDELRLGIGIATGEVVAGTIGSPKRMDYTVIGDSVNLAARLQEATKSYGCSIIVCERTAALISKDHRVRELDRIRLRGREKPARIFQVMTTPNAGVAHYQAGREALKSRDWHAAVASFDAALAARAGDGPASLMRARALSALATPPGDDWDGVW